MYIVIVSHTTGQKHRLYCTAGANCSSTNVIYCLECDTCGIQYVGCTNNLRLRLNNHKSCIRLHKEHRSTDIFRIYQHYRVSDGHYFKCTVLESRPDTDTLKHFESRWIYKLRTIHPSGLNILDNAPMTSLSVSFSCDVIISLSTCIATVSSFLFRYQTVF